MAALCSFPSSYRPVCTIPAAALDPMLCKRICVLRLKQDREPACECCAIKCRSKMIDLGILNGSVTDPDMTIRADAYNMANFFVAGMCAPR